MLYLPIALLSSTLFFSIAHAAPVQLDRRIDQVISDAKTAWEQACITAGGTQDQCSNIAVTAAGTLLESAGVCDQQNSADAMIDLAKQFNSNSEMIRLAQLFVQQPRNSPDKSQVPYCQVTPKNLELSRLFHCQFAGSNFSVFGGDQSGNVPLGLTALNPAGSCPANPSGPIPDGVQLNTLVTEPIAASGSTTSAGSAAAVASATEAPAAASVVALPPAASPSGVVSSCSSPA